MALRGPGESYSDVILRLAKAAALPRQVRMPEDHAGALPDLETFKLAPAIQKK
jgi:hypothetical protein